MFSLHFSVFSISSSNFFPFFVILRTSFFWARSWKHLSKCSYYTWYWNLKHIHPLDRSLFCFYDIRDTCQHFYHLVADFYIFHPFWLDGCGIVNQTKKNLFATPGKTKAVHWLLPVCPGWCGQRVGQGLILLMSVCTENEEGFLCLAYPDTLAQNCFQDPSVVKSENVFCTITQANTISQDKYVLLVSRPELK